MYYQDLQCFQFHRRIIVTCRVAPMDRMTRMVCHHLQLGMVIMRVIQLQEDCHPFLCLIIKSKFLLNKDIGNSKIHL